MIEEFGDELLIYDDSLKRAHSLGATAAGVWRMSDGSADVEAIAERLDTTETEVRYALDELEALGLMDSSGIEVVQSGESERSGITRRQMTMRSVKAGAAVVTAPLVYSINVNPALATLTPPPFVCELFTTGDCGSKGCGAIFGCCCCCTGGGLCKTCGSISACNATVPFQPCAPTQGGNAIGSGCSNPNGDRPADERGCCGVTMPHPEDCGCGWGIGGGCSNNTAPGPGGNNCTPADNAPSSCRPSCNGKYLVSTDTLGCCKSKTVDCCAGSNPTFATQEAASPGGVGCCAKSGFEPSGNHTPRDCCTNPTTGCCATNTCIQRAG